MTEIISPQITEIVRNPLNKTARIYSYEEIPYFYELKNIKVENLTNKAKSSENNIKDPPKINENNESILALNKSVKDNETKKVVRKYEKKKLYKLDKKLLFLERQTNILEETINKLKKENRSLKKKIDLKKKKQEKKRVNNKFLKRKNINFKKSKHKPDIIKALNHRKPLYGKKDRKNQLLKKMKKINRLEKILEI